MDFTPEINALERAVDYLREVLAMPLEKLTKRQSRKVFSKMTEHIDDIYYIDDLMPLEEFADKFTDPADRKAFFRVLDLLDEAFSLLDEILGPEEEWDPETLGDYQQAKPSRRKNDDGDDYPAMPGTMPSWTEAGNRPRTEPGKTLTRNCSAASNRDGTQVDEFFL